jgi:zinc protease
VLSGDTNKEDLELEFQLLTATISDPGYRPEAMRAARKRIEAAYLGFAHTERGPLALKVSADPRRAATPASASPPKRTTDDEAQPGRGEGLARPDPRQRRPRGLGHRRLRRRHRDRRAAKTLGTLPQARPRPALDDLRKVSFPGSPSGKDYAIDSEIPKSLVAVYWPTPTAWTSTAPAGSAVLADVSQDRLRVKVREQLGSTYSPSVASSASDILPGLRLLCGHRDRRAGQGEGDPGRRRRRRGRHGANGVTQDELDRAKNPIAHLKSARASARTSTG